MGRSAIVIMVLLVTACASAPPRTSTQGGQPRTAVNYSTGPGGSTLNIQGSGWRQHLGPSGTPGGTVNLLEYVEPNGRVTVSIRGEYHPGQSLSMRAGSTIPALTCAQTESAFRVSMTSEEFKKALADLGFPERVVTLGVDTPCSFASRVPVSQISITNIGAPIKIEAIAGGTEKSCTISQIKVFGCH